jgi:hypothetical protein
MQGNGFPPSGKSAEQRLGTQPQAPASWQMQVELNPQLFGMHGSQIATQKKLCMLAGCIEFWNAEQMGALGSVQSELFWQ